MTYPEALNKISNLLPQYQFSLASKQHINAVRLVVRDHEFQLGNEVDGYHFDSNMFFEASDETLREEISSHFKHYKVSTFQLAQITK